MLPLIIRLDEVTRMMRLVALKKKREIAVSHPCEDTGRWLLSARQEEGSPQERASPLNLDLLPPEL